MTRLSFALALPMTLIALAACSDEPTQPNAPGDQISRRAFLRGRLEYLDSEGPPPARTDWGLYRYGLRRVRELDRVRHRGKNRWRLDVSGSRPTACPRIRGPGSQEVTNVYNTNGVGKIGSRLYFNGGWDYGSGTPLAFGQTWAYDYTNGRLIKKADMPKATADGVSGVISNKLYVLPGTCSGDEYPNPRYCANEDIRTLFRYDPSTNTWVTRASAPHVHTNAAAGVINGKFYVAGGARDLGLNAAFDVYDPGNEHLEDTRPIAHRQLVHVGRCGERQAPRGRVGLQQRQPRHAHLLLRPRDQQVDGQDLAPEPRRAHSGRPQRQVLRPLRGRDRFMLRLRAAEPAVHAVIAVCASAHNGCAR